MVLSQVRTELKTLLGRNLFVRADLKVQLLDSSPETQAQALILLRKMDEDQTELFKKVLIKNPHFFSDLENRAIHEALQQVVAQEEAAHLSEIKAAEAELNNTLNMVNV